MRNSTDALFLSCRVTCRPSLTRWTGIRPGAEWRIHSGAGSLSSVRQIGYDFQCGRTVGR